MCSPGANSSVAEIFPTNSMTPVRLPPSIPMVHNALPRQLMPSEVTDMALKRIERRTLGCILNVVGSLVMGGLSV